MLDLGQHITKDNWHHAYLIEGSSENLLPIVYDFLKISGINTVANPDFFELNFDSLKIDDARYIKSLNSPKGYTGDKKIFIISTNSVLREAQNMLLKMFEEPNENTHFFFIIPDSLTLFKTFTSRFYFIGNKDKDLNLKDAEEFIKMSANDRIDFIKENFKDKKDEEEELDSNRTRAILLLNKIEHLLYFKSDTVQYNNIAFWEHMFKVRKFLNQPGSSVKSLMDGIALSIPKF